MRARALLLAGALATIGCQERSGTTGAQAGSQTHWMTPCESDATCEDIGACVCGVCAPACASQSECGAGVCQRSGAVADLCGGEPTGICVPPCAGDADCAAVREGLVCDRGVCVDVAARTDVGTPPDPACFTAGGFVDAFDDGVLADDAWTVVERPLDDTWREREGLLRVDNDLSDGRSALLATRRRFEPPFAVLVRGRVDPRPGLESALRVRVLEQTADTWYEAAARTGGDGSASFLGRTTGGEAEPSVFGEPALPGVWYRLRVEVTNAEVRYALAEDDGGSRGPVLSLPAEALPAAPVGLRVGAANGLVTVDWMCVVPLE